jgi:hypothetical protein
MSEQPNASQKNNPLHGLTLEAIVTALVAHYGWEALGQQINIRCFTARNGFEAQPIHRRAYFQGFAALGLDGFAANDHVGHVVLSKSCSV